MSQETIEKKLAYLDETKQMIGQALVTKGQTINNETPFRDYVQKVLDIQTGFDTRDATAVASEVLKGKTFYNSTGKVEGTLVLKTGDVKKFETVEEMQNDANAQEGDLAVVYRSEIQAATVDSQFQMATFPKTVVLDTAITSSVRLYYYPVDTSVMFDCMGSLSATRFSLDCYTDTDSFRITYTSTDGITYTRTDTLDETLDFGTLIYFARPEYWDDRIGNFIKCGGNTFEGLYQYATKQDKTKMAFIKNIKLVEGTLQYDSDIYNGLDTGFITEVYNNIQAYFQTTNSWDQLTFCRLNNEICCYVTIIPSSPSLKGVELIESETGPLYIGPYSSYKDYDVYKVTLGETYTYTLLDKTTITGNITLKGVQQINDAYELLNVSFYPEITPDRFVCYKYTGGEFNVTMKYGSKCDYDHASSQLTLSQANELLPGKIAYGKSGIIEGDGSIYNNLDMKALMQSLLNYDITNEAIFTYNQNGKTKKIKDIEPNGQECYTETINIYPKLPEEIKEKIASQIPSFFWCNDKYYVIVVKDSTGSTIYILDLNYNILNEITSDISYMNNFDICEENDNIYIILQNSTAINIYKFATEVNSLELVKNTTEPDKPYSYAFLLEVDELNDTYWLIGESASSKYSIYYSSISGNDSFTLLTTVSSSHDSNLRNQTAIEKDNNYIYCLVEHYSNYSILVAINRSDKTFKTWTGTANDCGPVAYIFKIGNTVYLNRIKSGLYKLDGINQTLLIAYDASKTSAIPWNMATYYLEASNTPIFTGDFHNSDYPEGRSYENPRYVYNSLTQKILNNGYIVNYTGVANTGFYGDTFYDLITYRDSNKIKSTWISNSYNNTCYMLVSTVYFNKMLEDTTDISDILNIKSYPEGTISIRFNINPGALTSEEYQTALDTALDIRDGEVE